jgi:hypothetical protein
MRWSRFWAVPVGLLVILVLAEPPAIANGVRRRGALTLFGGLGLDFVARREDSGSSTLTCACGLLGARVGYRFFAEATVSASPLADFDNPQRTGERADYAAFFSLTLGGMSARGGGDFGIGGSLTNISASGDSGGGGDYVHDGWALGLAVRYSHHLDGAGPAAIGVHAGLGLGLDLHYDRPLLIPVLSLSIVLAYAP